MWFCGQFGFSQPLLFSGFVVGEDGVRYVRWAGVSSGLVKVLDGVGEEDLLVVRGLGRQASSAIRYFRSRRGSGYFEDLEAKTVFGQYAAAMNGLEAISGMSMGIIVNGVVG